MKILESVPESEVGSSRGSMEMNLQKREHSEPSVGYKFIGQDDCKDHRNTHFS